MKHFARVVLVQTDRVIGWLLVALGGVAVLLGARGVINARLVLDQLSYLATGAAGGLFLLGVGALLILTADTRDEWRRLDDLEALLRTLADRGDELGDQTGDGRHRNGRSAVGLAASTDASAVASTPAAPTPRRRLVASPSALAAGVAVALVPVALGGIAVLYARSVTDAVDVASWAGFGLAGLLFFVGFCQVTARREVAVRLRRVTTGMADALGLSAAAGRLALPGLAATAAAPLLGGGWHRVDGSGLVHHGHCVLLEHEHSTPVADRQVRDLGLTECAMCR
jgi:hypothetical protein